MKVTEEDKAYAAGFVEADGCIQLTGVRVTNRCLLILHWFEERFGGQIRSKVVPEGCWEWNIYAYDAETFIDLIYPFLKFKETQADLFKEYRSTIRSRGSAVPPDVLDKRKNLKDNLTKEKAKWKLN